MDGTRVMYRMKPIFELPERIELPTCMYSMKSINTKTNRTRCDNSNEILDIIVDKKPLPELKELETRWDRVIEQLNDLVGQVNSIKQQISNGSVNTSSRSQFTLNDKALQSLRVFNGAVVNASPTRIPYSLFLIKQLCNNFISFSTHVHSSVPSLPGNLINLCESYNNQNMKLTLIWKAGLSDPELVLNPVKQIPIKGEVNILRHLGRMGLEFLRYPLDDMCQTVQIDSTLDVCHRLLHTQATKELTSLYRNLNAKLGRNLYFGGENFNISDIAAWSVLKQINVNPSQDLTPNMVKWYNRMDDMLECC